MKKIVFIIDNVFSNGGIARVNTLLVDELLKTNKYDITILSLMKNDGNGKYKIPDDCKLLELDIPRFIIRKHTFKVAKQIKKLFSKDFEGTFVINDVGHTIPAWLGLKHCKKAKFICWSHTNFFNGSKYGFSGLGKRLAVKKFDKVIALTKEDKSYYDKILNASNVIQIYNPKDASLKKCIYSDDSKKIISCGRLDPIKRFDKLIDVAKMVFDEVDGWVWDIYGDGSERQKLERKIEDNKLIGKVNLKGYTSNIFDLYKGYAFCVFTSQGEGCPMAMIEALASGIPMVSFDFKCGPKDLIIDSENGFIIENFDLIEMKNRILQLINSQELRKKFANNSDVNLAELDMSYVIEQWKKIL